MKYEERNNITTLLVEPGDERAVVLNWLCQWQQKRRGRIVVVVPQDAVFRRPGDLRELQLAMAGQHQQLVLVIEGNERLRLWARRQGFTVYATLETCQMALSPQGTIQQPGSEAQSSYAAVTFEQLPPRPFYGYGARRAYADQSSDTPGETYRSSVAVVDSRASSGFQHTEGRAVWTVEHNTEPLTIFVPSISVPNEFSPVVERPYAQDVRPSHLMYPVAQAPFPAEPAFIFNTSSNMSLSVEGPEMEKIQEQAQPWWGIIMLHLRQIRRDKLLLALVALVLLGMLGALGLGYFLTLIHTG